MCLRGRTYCCHWNLKRLLTVAEEFEGSKNSDGDLTIRSSIV
jgi:hypothetical protein